MSEPYGRRSETTASEPDRWGPGYTLWQSILGLLAQRGPDATTPIVRMGSHILILLVAVMVLWLSRVQLPQWDIAQAPIEEMITEIVTAEDYLDAVPASEENAAEAIALVRAAVPITLIPERQRLETITHTVVAGDTLYGIAQRYSLRAETIMWVNGLEKNPGLLRLGQKLAILPVDGIYHTVASGDTLDKIAKTYSAKTASIIEYAENRLDAGNPIVVAGQRVFVPGGTKAIPVTAQIYRGTAPASARRGSGRFVWPTTGTITQGYKPLHRALDIARSTGTPIKAADGGYVVAAGWTNSGYGYHIVIDHGNGYQTLYGHLSRLFVKRGDTVTQGAVIGNMGSTGRSTGPHLHFEVRLNGVLQNPVTLLP